MAIKDERTLSTQLEKNRTVFVRRVTKVRKFGTGHISSILAQRAATFACQMHTGYFFYRELEEHLAKISKTLNFNLLPEVPELPNSTLHVVSRTYSTGGHTRVIERWLEASDVSETHSIATLRQGPIGERLLSAIKARRGNVYLRHALNGRVEVDFLFSRYR